MTGLISYSLLPGPPSSVRLVSSERGWMTPEEAHFTVLPEVVLSFLHSSGMDVGHSCSGRASGMDVRYSRSGRISFDQDCSSILVRSAIWSRSVRNDISFGGTVFFGYSDDGLWLLMVSVICRNLRL